MVMYGDDGLYCYCFGPHVLFSPPKQNNTTNNHIHILHVPKLLHTTVCSVEMFSNNNMKLGMLHFFCFCAAKDIFRPQNVNSVTFIFINRVKHLFWFPQF